MHRSSRFWLELDLARVPFAMKPKVHRFPASPPLETEVGHDVFTEAGYGESKQRSTPHLYIGICRQKLDPATGQVIETLDEDINETEIDRRTLVSCFAAEKLEMQPPVALAFVTFFSSFFSFFFCKQSCSFPWSFRLTRLLLHFCTSPSLCGVDFG